jgi:hypothetical protein
MFLVSHRAGNIRYMPFLQDICTFYNFGCKPSLSIIEGSNLSFSLIHECSPICLPNNILINVYKPIKSLAIPTLLYSYFSFIMHKKCANIFIEFFPQFQILFNRLEWLILLCNKATIWLLIIYLFYENKVLNLHNICIYWKTQP